MRSPTLAILSLLVVFSVLAEPPTPEANYGEANGTLPNWEERVVAQLTNRARVDPAADLQNCPAGQCLEAACYSPAAPLLWHYDLNEAARFHSLTMATFPYFAHNTPCTLFPDIDSRFPGSSNGSFASSCSSSGTTTAGARVNLFGVAYAGENIAAGQSTPHAAFYAWLHEPTNTSACGFNQYNGHRYNILLNRGPGMGVGHARVSGSPYGTYWTQDFGGSGSIPKIPSGSHWTATQRLRDPSAADNAVEFWANWYDVAGGAPTSATVVLDNVPIAMTLTRGTATNGAYRATVSGVSTSCHTYYFAFVDSSLNAVRYPTTGVFGFGGGCADYENVGTAPPPAAPAQVNAIATSATQVQVTWSSVTGATSYEIYRRDPGGAFALRGTSLTTSFSDAASPGVAYLYRVRAVNAAGSSADSPADLATTVMFNDDPLVGGVRVQAVHLAELRIAVNAVRAQAGLSSAAYTDAAAAGVRIKAIHVTELRTYLDQALGLLGRPTGGWIGTLSGARVDAIHFQQIRDRVK